MQIASHILTNSQMIIRSRTSLLESVFKYSQMADTIWQRLMKIKTDEKPFVCFCCCFLRQEFLCVVVLAVLKLDLN